MNKQQLIQAPEIEAIEWLNINQPISLQELRGKVVVIHAFQMLCPGCVTHGLPQTKSIYELYPNEQVQVIGLHSVFEHHDVMTIEALKVFIHEYQLKFPIAVDQPSEKDVIPKTMRTYQLQGTPSLILIDKNGQIRLNYFGQLHDMQVGNLIGQMINEPTNENNLIEELSEEKMDEGEGCDEDGCLIK